MCGRAFVPNAVRWFWDWLVCCRIAATETVALPCFANVFLPNAGKNCAARLVFAVEKKRARLLGRAL